MPVPYFRALFITVLATTYKSYQVSASRLVKYLFLFTTSEGRLERGSSTTGSGSTQVFMLGVYEH